MSNKYDRHYPAIPLRNVTVFPGMVMHFDVSRKKSVKAVEASMAADELIYLVTQRDSQVSEPGIADLYTVGTIAKIKQIIKILMKYNCKPYIMKFKMFEESPHRGIYIIVGRWCNQPSLFFKMSTTFGMYTF